MNTMLLNQQSYNALAILKNGDFRNLKKIWEKYGDWLKAWRDVSRKEKRSLDPEKAWVEMRILGIDLVLRDEENFPKLLKEIPQSPLGIYYKGSLEAAQNPALAIVGTRKATTNGLSVAKNFSRELAEAGVNIISGLALGIDTAAHLGALEGEGKTTAVLASGLDEIYPSQNIHLAEKILMNKGLIISEYPIKSETLPYRFIERNRIISGLSNATIIIEAPPESGALATAKFALDQNRDIGAIPGPINHQNYFGNHSLIKSGAALITSTTDILSLLNLDQLPLKFKKSLELSENEQIIVNALKSESEALTVDKIIEIVKLDPQIVQRATSLLLMKDIIRESGNGYEIN